MHFWSKGCVCALVGFHQGKDEMVPSKAKVFQFTLIFQQEMPGQKEGSCSAAECHVAPVGAICFVFAGDYPALLLTVDTTGIMDLKMLKSDIPGNEMIFMLYKHTPIPYFLMPPLFCIWFFLVFVTPCKGKLAPAPDAPVLLGLWKGKRLDQEPEKAPS